MLDFDSMTDVEVHNMIRALVPPTMPSPELLWLPSDDTLGFASRRIYAVETRIIKREYRGVPWALVAKWPSGVVIICKNRGLLFTKVMLDGEIKPARDVLPEVWE